MLLTQKWKSEMSKKLIGWGFYLLLVLALFASSAMRYAAPVDGGSEAMWRFWMIWLHLGFGMLPLILGAVQLMGQWQFKRPSVHRLIGRVYVICIVISGSAAIWLGLNSELPMFGYALLVLDVVWWLTTGIAVYHIRKRQVLQHRQWMIRSFLVTNAFVIFRLMIPLAIAIPAGTIEAKFAIAVTLAWVLPLAIYQRYQKRAPGTIKSSPAQTPSTPPASDL